MAVLSFKQFASLLPKNGEQTIWCTYLLMMSLNVYTNGNQQPKEKYGTLHLDLECLEIQLPIKKSPYF